MIDHFHPDLGSKTELLFRARFQEIHAKTDRIFGFLFLFQWFLSVVFAMTFSPRTWSGETSHIHLHVYAAVFLGGALALGPIALILRKPGAPINRFVISVSQILFSTLLIHFTSGRIETHFHIFGSLAFLAFYRDWKPILIAAAITAADHFLRGIYFPLSIYGVLSASPYRAAEHTAWVLFEVFILFASVTQSRRGLYESSNNLAKLELTISLIEQKVEERTKELKLIQLEKEAQQLKLIQSSKLSALGEMAGGIAHEINNPLSTIRIKASQLQRLLEKDDLKKDQGISFLKTIEDTSIRMSKIIEGLRTFARDGGADTFSEIYISKIFSDVSGLCQERMKSKGVQFDLILAEDFLIECRPTQIEQVLINLVNNSFDAISSTAQPWIRIEAIRADSKAKIFITDSGMGIPKQVADKIMEPFFTTKGVGHGTGLGLSISHGIANLHGGSLTLNPESEHTQFILTISLKQDYTTKT